MSNLISKYIRSDRSKLIVAVALFITAAVIFYLTLGNSHPAGATKNRVAIDAVSGTVFTIPLVVGESAPWQNPDTGERTLYPAEKCYWTRDGKAKLEPTLVFVKYYLGSKEKTLCPDCGREVKPHNPLPPDELMAKAAEEKNKK